MRFFRHKARNYNNAIFLWTPFYTKYLLLPSPLNFNQNDGPTNSVNFSVNLYFCCVIIWKSFDFRSKTPGNRSVYLYPKKRGSVPKCGDCKEKLKGVRKQTKRKIFLNDIWFVLRFRSPRHDQESCLCSRSDTRPSLVLTEVLDAPNVFATGKYWKFNISLFSIYKIIYIYIYIFLIFNRI